MAILAIGKKPNWIIPGGIGMCGELFGIDISTKNKFCTAMHINSFRFISENSELKSSQNGCRD